MEDAAIIVEDLTKYYRKYSRRHQFQTLKSAIVRGSIFRELKPAERILALEDVSFTVPKGKTVGIIGSNGAGKSTLLKIIAGTLKPTSGRVEVRGRVSALIELGAGFHPEISGRENTYINGIMLGLSKKEIDRKFDEIVRFAELEDFIDQPVKTYSSGMYLRLGFAIAINVDPDVLLVDEVIAVGDESFSRKCVDKFNEFRWRKKTILLVTHSLGMVTKLCDQAIWLDRGRIKKIGDPQMVVDAYLAEVAMKEEEELIRLHGEAAKEVIRRKRQGLETDFGMSRWGSREVEIEKVRLLDFKGKERHVFISGEPMVIEMEVSAQKKIKDFVFGVGIFNAEGVSCYGTNTYIENFQPRSLGRRAKVRFIIDKLNLIEGTYYLDVAVHKENGFPYDYHRHLYTIRVNSRLKDIGIFRPDHRWEFEGDLTIERRGR